MSLTLAVVSQLREVIQRGGIIAYPTEGAYGLGCDPFNESAVNKIIKIKGRISDKGFILIASSFDQVEDLISPIDSEKFKLINSTWPGPVTWVFPCSDKVPPWIRGKYNSVALRITAHPVAREICHSVNQAIVSTSANRSGESPLLTAQQVKQTFHKEIDLIIEGKIGELTSPTPIRDALTGEYLRRANVN